MRELRERAEPIVKIVCLILAAVLLYQLAGVFFHWNPFRSVAVPALPTLTASTNTPAGGSHGTNLTAAAMAKGTNGTQRTAGTNSVLSAMTASSNSAAKGTNSIAPAESAQMENKLSSTNNLISTNAAGTNLLISTTSAGTNTAPSTTGTNPTARVEFGPTKTNAATNVVAELETRLTGTNSVLATNVAVSGTNVLATKTGSETNAVSGSKPGKKNAPGMPPEMAGGNFNPFGPPGKSNVELPPAMKSRITKITDSEILGPVMRPLPQALLGIAGEFAFLRSANGQTGLVKTGDYLDDIKLLGIGINRVLIEQDGQKKELTIFSGYGGDSLLQNNSTNENKHP